MIGFVLLQDKQHYHKLPFLSFMENENIQLGPQTMNFVEAIKTCLGKYVDFNGRASRAEYWWFFLATFIIGCIPFVNFLGVLLIVPSLAVSWRRMHDIGKGGGWWFINFIPLIGFIWFIVLAATKGEPTANRFGDAPIK